MKKKEKNKLKALFTELKNGNKKVVEELYEEYNKTVYGIAFSILKNNEDSEDIVQTVFAKLYTLDKEKMPNDKELTWLYAVTKNETLSFLRKKNSDIDLETIYDLENKESEIDNLINKETYNNLVSKLDNKEKEIVSLKVIANLSFSQIAELLGEPTGTIKWRYYKSIYALKIMLTNLGMFVVTFILGLSTFKQTKKIADVEINQEVSKENATEDLKDETSSTLENEDVMIRDETSSELVTENVIIRDETQENLILEYSTSPKQHSINYLGYGIMSISAIFLILTIIFAIILKKYQLNLRKKSSK